MARKAMVVKNNRRKKLSEKALPLRKELRAKVKNQKLSEGKK